ncbi:MAG: FAD-dependent oxidoreductase [Bacteroidetes bacterium]|nr:MAG: FAD-dependent oxidoreductase [Bacteroidota bacterium]
MTNDVIIVGGGLSGLGAAVELASKGARVILFEQSPKLGGRCYSYIDATTGDIVDNGQHVLVGAYHHTLRYLEMIGTRSYLKGESRLSLPFFHPEQGIHTFSVSVLPKPFHLTTGMLQFSLLSFKERKRLLNVGLELQQWNSNKEQHLSLLTIDEWLTSLNQSEEAKKNFWNPIAISVMNELPERASALLFARSLRSTFLGKKADSRLLIPTIGQTELYVHGAEEVLRKHKAIVRVNTSVDRILINSGNSIGVEAGGKIEKAHSIICAAPYFTLQKLLPDEITTIVPFSHLNKFKSSPIVSLHLWFDKEFMEQELIGLIDMQLQWVFNRRKILKEGGKATSYISAVISGAHDVVHLSKEELLSLALKDIHRVFPESKKAKFVHSVIIKEKRATFSPLNETEQYRHSTETPIKNLYLAGDWTNTGLPGTIEGAVMSGFKAAERCG